MLRLIEGDCSISGVTVSPTIVGEVVFISAQVDQSVIEFVGVDLIDAQTNSDGPVQLNVR